MCGDLVISVCNFEKLLGMFVTLVEYIVFDVLSLYHCIYSKINVHTIS